ncbi:hypothetical protein EV421DRAFT_1130519 [Armillaria borealis]|uniref:DUF6699 domain-containing protein n=1 Tax=Armillaria borealis TaxID=47425 RepID=A0AA39J4W4_9AGAR|nr:hypothetical protein EV421DRAFT_1130519 [Armillaria borealis]
MATNGHRHDISSPGASYKGSVHENIASPLQLVLGKPCRRHIPLPSQTESNITIVVHPLLVRSSRGEMLMELEFARSLSGVRVFGHEGCVKEEATNPPLPSMAIVHPKLPWPVVIQRSDDREWVTAADVIERLWSALQVPIPFRTLSSLLKDQDDLVLNSCHSTSDWVEQEIVPRLGYLKGKMRFMGLRAIGSDTWELLVACNHRYLLPLKE